MAFRPFSWPSALFGSDEELYGSKPVVPESPEFGEIAGEQIRSNIANLPSLKELAELSTDALTDVLERTLPGYSTLRDAGTNTLTSWARGELTPEMDADIQRRAAEMGITLGTSESDFSGHRGLKLGLDTRLQIQEKGLSAASRWLQEAQNRTFDFTKMFIFDPFREGEFDWQRDWLAEQVRTAPDPAKRGAADAELTGVGITAGIFGGNNYTGGRYQPSYGANMGGGGAGGAGGGGGSFFGVGNYVNSSGGGAPGGGSFSDYYGGGGAGGVSPYGNTAALEGYNPSGLSPYNY